MSPSRSYPSSILHLLLPLILLLIPFAPAYAIECHTSADCADKKRCTIDYCEPTKNLCYNFPRSASSTCKSSGRHFTLKKLRNATNAAVLTPAERLVIIEAAVKVMRDVHPHRDMHLKLLGVDPIPSLESLARPLRVDVSANRTVAAMSTFDFHQRMISIFNIINDLHTTYRAPGVLRTSLAVLPFTVRHYYDHNNMVTKSKNAAPKRKYVVTDVAHGFIFGNSNFRKGVRVTSFDYADIDVAILNTGAAGVGANPAARISRGCRRLTRRFLRRQLVPTRPFATVGFLVDNWHIQYVNIPWIVANFEEPPADPLGESASVSSNAMHAHTFERGAEGLLPKLSKMSWEMDKNNSNSPVVLNAGSDSPKSRARLPVDPYVASHMRGEVMQTKHGKLGVIKIYDYNSFFFGQFLKSFLKLVIAMQDHACVIDVRGNNGGIVYLAQMSIQFFTRNTVKPILFSERITAVTAALENALPKSHGRNRRASSFTQSMRYGLRAGDQFSGAFSLISEQLFQDYNGGRYDREMYVLTDAETYSSGDVFAASCQDNEAAFIIGTDETTGAGGSSSVFYSEYLHVNCPHLFPKLPGDVDFALSHRRMNRVGAYAGIAIENFGVTPDKRYYPTYRDRVFDDEDLFEFLGKFISDRYAASQLRSPAPTPFRINLFPPSTGKQELEREVLPSQEP